MTAATLCTLCERPLDGPRLADPATGGALHAACLARRLPQDALVAALAALALVLGPPVVVWAS
jgi:hypothetical protein